MSTFENIVGIIPAGGIGKRMRPLKLWKELVPVGYKTYSEGDGYKFVPRIIAEYTLENMVFGGAQRIVMILNDQKTELLRFFGSGHQYGTSLAYLCQEIDSGIYGMPVALDLGYEWIKDYTVVMGMPDTIVEPFDCFKCLLDMHNDKSSDLTLGVFPTDKPNRLAPVRINSTTGRVEAIFDKPKETKIFNTWNIAAWSSVFTEFLHRYLEDYKQKKKNTSNEILLSDVFSAAINKGLNVYGLFYETGKCYDLGDIDEFIKIRARVEEEHTRLILTKKDINT